MTETSDFIKQNPKPKEMFHKETGKRVEFTPWLECVDPVLAFDGKEVVMPDCKDRIVKFGALVQVGWLIQNGNGVWMGVGMEAINEFEEKHEKERDGKS